MSAATSYVRFLTFFADMEKDSRPVSPLRRWVLALLVLLSIAVRLPGLYRPLVGNFATRNVANAMMARNWALGRSSAWYPTVDCAAREAGSVSGCSNNPPEARSAQRSLIMLDLPISCYLTGAAWSMLGGSLDVWGRATAIAFSAVSAGLLYLLVRRWHNEQAAIAATLVFALSPVNLIYGQSFMLEPSLVCFLLASFYGLQRWLHRHEWRWLALFTMALACLLLTKVYMLTALLPIAAMITSHKKSIVCWALVATILALLPAAAWCLHVWSTAAPDSPFAQQLYYSFRQSAEVHRFPHPLLLSPGFYAALTCTLATSGLTPLGLLLACVGLFHSEGRRHWPWLVSCAALFVALPLKFHQMNYYFLALLPPLCIVAGLGWDSIARRWQPSRTMIAACLVVGLLLSLRYSVRPAFVTPLEDRAVVAAGRCIRQLTEPQQTVVTMHGSTIDLLYYCERVGWAISPKKDPTRLAEQLAECQRRGAELLVVAGDEQFAKFAAARELVRQLPLVCQGDGFWVYRLTAELSPNRDGHSKMAQREDASGI